MRIEANRLLWDAWNLAHIGRHGITRGHVAEVIAAHPLAVTSYRSRVVLVGPRNDGRVLVVVLDLEPGGFFYCVSARRANRREVRRYLAGQEEGTS